MHCLPLGLANPLALFATNKVLLFFRPICVVNTTETDATLIA